MGVFFFVIVHNVEVFLDNKDISWRYSLNLQNVSVTAEILGSNPFFAFVIFDTHSSAPDP